jgi:hypothetical protein
VANGASRPQDEVINPLRAREVYAAKIVKSRANVRRLAPPAMMIAAIACGIIAVASCTNGTAYDGAYEGGFSAGPDGSTVITIAPGAAGPLVYRAADGAFGVYFKQGTFAASATITISAQGTVGKTDGGPGGPGYAVKIEGAAPTMPYAVFFNSNGGIGSNGNAITANDVLLGVQGNAGGGVFGIAEQTTTNATFAFVPISSGGGQGEPQLPACLAGCNLQANNGSNPYCSISGASNNDVIATFDCIIGCPDPATLGAQCSSTSHNLRCGSKTCVTNQVCCRTGSTAGDSALQCEAPPCTEKLAQFECVTATASRVSSTRRSRRCSAT